MRDYKRISTSAEVYAVIKVRHTELKVFSSFSDPEGTAFGGCGMQGRMETSYGFEGSDYPILDAKTTWDIDRDQPYKRVNEKHEFWLCLPIKEQD